MPSDMSQLNDWEGNLNPPVSSGPFNFGALRPGEQGSLVGNPDYKDALNGVVNPAGYIYKQVPDANVEIEQFLAGETNLIDSPTVGRRADLRATNAQVYSYPGDFFDYLAFNLADPTNPQPGVDDKGNPIDQGHHPIFGDVRVRKALAHAIDVQALIKAAVFGEGTQMSSFLSPTSWAHDAALSPVSFDPTLAGQMLDEAGWIDDDNDASTPRVAKGAMYAPDGMKFEFTIYGNNGNTRRTAEGTLIQDQLAQIGVKAEFEAIDFNTELDIMNGQTFDAIMLAWSNSYPDFPDATQLYTPQSDLPGSGSDFTSYNNPEFNKLNNQAKLTAGCKPEDRAPIFHQMEKIIQDDQPYLWLYTINGMYAAGANVEGFKPWPSNMLWNVDTWKVTGQ